MKIIKGLDDTYLAKLKATVCCLGVFDGVHLGHQKIIKRTVVDAKKIKAKSVILTFESHPKKTTHKESPPILTTVEKKIGLFKKFKVNILVIINFNKRFADISAKNFIEHILVKKLKVKKVVVGFNYHFGKDKQGDTQLLKEEGKKYNFKVHIIKPVKVGNLVVSSTNIRKFIIRGDLRTPEEMIKRYYSVTGKVIKGDSRGKVLGVPTANLNVFNEVIPVEGVYAVKVKIGNKIFKGVCNISRPSFDVSQQENLIPEIFIFKFKKNIYGQIIEVFFIRKIRDSRFFNNINELIDAINEDIRVAKEIFSLQSLTRGVK